MAHHSTWRFQWFCRVRDDSKRSNRCRWCRLRYLAFFALRRQLKSPRECQPLRIWDSSRADTWTTYFSMNLESFHNEQDTCGRLNPQKRLGRSRLDDFMRSPTFPRYKAYCDSLQKLTLSSWHVWSHQSRSGRQAEEAKKKYEEVKRKTNKRVIWTNTSFSNFIFLTSTSSNPGMLALHQYINETEFQIFSQEMAKIKRLEMEKANKAATIAGMNMYKKATCHDPFGLKSPCFLPVQLIVLSPCTIVHRVFQVLWDNTSLLLTAWKDITKDELLSRTAWKVKDHSLNSLNARTMFWLLWSVVEVAVNMITHYDVQEAGEGHAWSQECRGQHEEGADFDFKFRNALQF